METHLTDIYEAFAGKLIGSFQMKTHVCETLAQMPDEVITYITRNCWFVSSFEDAWAFAFTGNDLRDQHLIFLSDELLLQKEYQIHWTVAHEIGHIILKHRNSVLVQQSKEEITQQEKDADTFASQFFSHPTM